jgi:DNA processing protein
MHLSLSDSSYPVLLKKIPDPPEILYVEGNYSSDIFTDCIAFVGTRNITPYGINVVNKLISELSLFECTIVSGFSRGVDINVHEACIKYGLRTISVIPFGIGYGKKQSSRDLIIKITQHQGLILSEYPEDFEPKKWSFVRRNRLIAGLSTAILVVEAAENSGSLITAKFGHTYGKPVYVVPGNIFSPYSTGIYELLFKYGNLVISGGQLANWLQLNPRKAHNSSSSVSIAEKVTDTLEVSIINLLKSDSLSALDIALSLDVDISILIKHLMLLTAQSKIALKEGRYHAL